MKVFIIGAGGRVGTALATKLAADGHEVFAGVHHVADQFAGTDIHVVAYDLHASVDEQAKQLGDVDAVYFVAGSRSKDLLQTDAFGVVQAGKAAKQNGIKRFVLLSSLFATRPEKWNTAFLAKITDYNIAKFFADEWLIDHSDLDYTILQPGLLQDDQPATGKIKVNVEDTGANPIPDVVTVLATLLEKPNTIGKVITMYTGDTPISDALDEI
ncbi:NAD(P)H-binding protein [Furfurilactobacillus siliginis]|uniref:Flavin reductase n=1 Tax=Furfurilactobacillus siliginis TaxID=348151 RepID=A0A0R2LDC7_9LACO|nr:NAD(P)H-binding protein [Furfurilactobacillus siliginis]KRN97228.1 flavin reductase [Furfurilactobacillus siliginis]GEK29119.1 oxidoreductase [Furfurilactobacillus siliginis]